MITGNDLINIDFLLAHLERIVNQSKERKDLIEELRNKIHKELNEIKVKIIKWQN